MYVIRGIVCRVTSVCWESKGTEKAALTDGDFSTLEWDLEGVTDKISLSIRDVLGPPYRDLLHRWVQTGGLVCTATSSAYLNRDTYCVHVESIETWSSCLRKVSQGLIMRPVRPDAAMKEEPQAIAPLEHYSVFNKKRKWCIVALVAYAAWFSTMSSFIYYPALHQLANFFSVSQSMINLTVTSYMAVATVAPTLLGDAADVLGRRPVYVIALTLYVVANIAIALAKSYAALLGLRVLQALAISGK